MGRSISRKNYVCLICKYIVAAILLVFFLYPFFVLITRSFMDNDDIRSLPVKFFPSHWTWENYEKALDASLLKYFKNTFIVIAFNVIAIPLASSFCAFGFSKVKFRFREVWFGFVLSTVMLPSIVTQIPLYVWYSDLGWLNTLYPLIIPAFFGGGAINIFLTRQFMRNIPSSIDEAATIDGANPFVVYWKIIMPLCMPITLFIMVNAFLGVWNDFMGPLIYIKNEDLYTIGLGIYMKFNGPETADNLANVQMATGMIMMIPCLIIFFLFQKQLMQGVTFSGLKG